MQLLKVNCQPHMARMDFQHEALTVAVPSGITEFILGTDSQVFNPRFHTCGCISLKLPIQRRAAMFDLANGGSRGNLNELFEKGYPAHAAAADELPPPKTGPLLRLKR
jgi:hypothetical protein